MKNSHVYSTGALDQVKAMHAQEPFDLFLTDSNPLEHDTIAELRKMAPIGVTFHGVGIDGLLSSINDAALAAASHPDTVDQNVLNTLSQRAMSAGREAAYFGYAYDFIIGITPLATRNFREVYRIASQKLFTILNGIDTARYTPTNPAMRSEARRVLGLPEDALILSFAGKLETAKGFFELAAVAPALLRYVPKLHIIVAGSGSGTKTCQVLDASNDNFHCLGALDQAQLALFYQSSNMLIEPALHYLGLNTVVLEAVCSGIPVISADAARMTETFGFGHSAPSYFSMGDRLDMVKAVVEAAAMEDEEREEWGQALRRRWCPRFSVETEATQYNELFWWQVHQRNQRDKVLIEASSAGP